MHIIITYMYIHTNMNGTRYPYLHYDLISMVILCISEFAHRGFLRQDKQSINSNRNPVDETK